jgi:hypothetical protein
LSVGCQKNTRKGQAQLKSETKAERAQADEARASVPRTSNPPAEGIKGRPTSAQLDALVAALEAAPSDEAREALLTRHLSHALLSVNMCAELLGTLSSEQRLMSALQALAPRLVEDEGDERHALLDLFERPALRARAVDLLGWH